MNVYVDLAAILLALLAIYTSLRYKIPQEKRRGDADLALQYDDIATRAASRTLSLEKQVDGLQARIEQLRKDIEILRQEKEELDRIAKELKAGNTELIARIVALEDEISGQRDWIDRLTRQLLQLRQVPARNPQESVEKE